MTSREPLGGDDGTGSIFDEDPSEPAREPQDEAADSSSSAVDDRTGTGGTSSGDRSADPSPPGVERGADVPERDVNDQRRGGESPDDVGLKAMSCEEMTALANQLEEPPKEPDTASGHYRIVLAGILPDNSDWLAYARERLQPEHLHADTFLRNLYAMICKFAVETGGGVLTRDALTDYLNRDSKPSGSIVQYTETYDELASRRLKPDEVTFRHSVEESRARGAKDRLGDVLTDSLEILTKGKKDEHGQMRSGHDDALAFVNVALEGLDSAPHEPRRSEIDRRKREDAEREIARAERAAESINVEPAEIVDLKELLDSEDEGEDFRINELMPERGHILITAPAKAGKTTVTGNLARSWADDAPLFGRFTVNATGPLLIIDPEMPERLAKRWLRAQHIENTSRIRYVNIQGKCSTFNILSPPVRAEWVAKIRASGASAVLLDGLAPVLGAIGLSESNEDVRAFLAAWNLMLEEAGVAESFICHHMGWVGERVRGASSLLDWCTAQWMLVFRNPDNRAEMTGPRFFKANGRDVEVSEVKLDYDAETHRYTVAGGSRADDRAQALLPDVAHEVELRPGINSGQLVTALTRETPGSPPVSRETARDAISRATEHGDVVTTQNGRATCYWLPGTAPVASPAALTEPPPGSLEKLLGLPEGEDH